MLTGLRSARNIAGNLLNDFTVLCPTKNIPIFSLFNFFNNVIFQIIGTAGGLCGFLYSDTRIKATRDETMRLVKYFNFSTGLGVSYLVAFLYSLGCIQQSATPFTCAQRQLILDGDAFSYIRENLDAYTYAFFNHQLILCY